jgi:hypothetical protein
MPCCSVDDSSAEKQASRVNLPEDFGMTEHSFVLSHLFMR